MKLTSAGKEKLTEIFGVDLRSMALFRICLSLVLIVDLIQRSTSLTAFYTDQGVLPRRAVYELLMPNQGMWASPYYFSGEAWWVITLFVINGIFLVGLLVGYKTRLMTAICWFLLTALSDRNALILHAGDILARVVLFWSLFIPTGAKWSLDSLLVPSNAEPPPKNVLSAGTVCYLLQIAFVYWFSMLMKWNVDWFSGKAVFYTLSIEQFTTPFGHWLVGHLWLTIFLTYAVMCTELFGPIFAFCPVYTGPVRTFVVFCFIFMHLCFGLALSIGIFSFISMVVWLPFLPSWFWDRVMSKIKIPVKFRDFITVTPKVIERLKKWFDERPLIVKYSIYENLFAAVLLICVLFYNFDSVNKALDPDKSQNLSVVNRRIVEMGLLLHMYQNWGMFSRPLKDDGWFVIDAHLISGKELDIFDIPKELSWDKPASVNQTFLDTRWIKYLEYLAIIDYVDYRQFYAQYLCRSWNKAHQGLETLEWFRIYFMLNRTHSDFTKGPPEKYLLWTHYCLASAPIDKPQNKK